MKPLQILKMGHPGLLKKSRRIKPDDMNRAGRLSEKMTLTLKSISAIGLAAPQAGVPLRMFVYCLPKNRIPKNAKQQPVPWTVAVNPVIKPLVKRKRAIWERCLSLPDLYGKVPRYPKIKLIYQDISGKKHERIATGYHASLIQHEVDHLDGILYPMRIKDLSFFSFSSEIKAKGRIYRYSASEFD